MNVSTYGTIRTSIYLDRIEEFVANNDKGLPFYVRQMHYSGGDTVAISGAAKVKTPDPETGDRGFIDRYATVRLEDLEARYRDLILGNREAYLQTLTVTSD